MADPLNHATDAAQARRYDPVGICIYCGAKRHSRNRSKLGDEHIVPEGLGGLLILPNASCGSCEGEINRFEQFCQKDMLAAFRFKEGLPTKRPKDRPTELPAEKLVDGQVIQVMLPVAGYPIRLHLPLLPSPEILRPHPLRKSPLMSWRMYPHAHDPMSEDIFETSSGGVYSYLSVDGIRVASGQTKYDRFGGMLSKIAHGFAVGELGVDGFTPLLWDRGSLENEFPRHLLLGGEDSAALDLAPGRHPLLLVLEEHNGRVFWVVHFRLFADLDWPQYRCVVGYPKGVPKRVSRIMLRSTPSILPELTKIRIGDEPRRVGVNLTDWHCASCRKLLATGGNLPPWVAAECTDCGTFNLTDFDDRPWVLPYKDHPNFRRFMEPNQGCEWFDVLDPSPEGLP